MKGLTNKTSNSIWISIEKRKPRVCDDILFTNGEIVYAGWLETYEFGEELSFFDAIDRVSCDDITHWAQMPEPPEEG